MKQPSGTEDVVLAVSFAANWGIAPQAVPEGDGRSPHHRHFGDEQELYAFVSVRRLMADFLADVDKVRQDA